MKDGMFMKGLSVGIIVLFFSISITSSANLFNNNISTPFASGKTVYVDDNTQGPWDGTLGILRIDAKLHDIPINCKRIENLFENVSQQELISITSKSSNKMHPTFDRTNSGIHLTAYHDEELNGIIWIYSDDDGRTYKEGVQGEFGDYPMIKHWDKKIFCGTSVTDYNDTHGNVIYFFRAEDPKDINSYMIYLIDPNLPHAPPFGKMKDTALACDNTLNNSYYWGAASYIINVGSYNNVPLLLYPESPSDYLFRMSYYEIENCYHTDIDIDNETKTIYAIYDCYNTTDNSWRLYTRVKDFLDLQNGYDALFEIQDSEGLQYPVITANNNTVIILAETEENGNKDIVCLRSADGLNTIQKSFLTISGDDERFPKIEYVNNTIYICTFIKNEKLYKMITEDGGQTWGIPELIDTNVISEYRSVTISTSASQVLYEKNIEENIDLSISPLRSYNNDPDLQIPSISGGDQIEVSLLNNGGSDESNIYWWINISGAINKNVNGIIPLLNAGDTFTIVIDNLLGLGDINLQAIFELPNRQKIKREIVGYLNKNYIENIKFLWDTSKILYVDDDGVIGGIGSIDSPFVNIGFALWASSHGDSIYVAEGIYYAWLDIFKSVRLLGEDKNKTFIEADHVNLKACGNVYSGFTNLGTDVVLWGEYNLVTNNIFLGARIFILGFSNYVIDNDIDGSNWGIVFESSAGHHFIKQNTIENCSENGILYRGSTPDNIITDNEISNNKYAIYIYVGPDVDGNYFINNLIKDNTYGLIFNQLYNSVIQDNIIKDNTGDGISLTYSQNNLVKSNTFENNMQGIYLENSLGNRITNNNFILNSDSATFHHYSGFYHNTWFRNYWDDKGVSPIKFIHGEITYNNLFGTWTFGWINIDFFPARKPYDITNIKVKDWVVFLVE